MRNCKLFILVSCLLCFEIKAYGEESTQQIPIGDDYVSGTWTITGGSGTRWDAVNDSVDTPDDATSYIQCTAVGMATFTFSGFSIPSCATITSVNIYFRCYKSGFQSSAVGAVLKVGGTGGGYFTGTTTNPFFYFWITNNSIAINAAEWTTNPATGAVWTVDDINGTSANPLQAFGLNVTDVNPNIRCTQVYVEVNYTVPSNGEGPTGEDSVTGTWTVVGGNGTLWDAVNDPVDNPDDATSYIQCSAAGMATFTFSPFSIPCADITNVKVYFRCYKNGFQASAIGAVIKIGDGYFTGTTTNPTFYAWITSNSIELNAAEWTINPATGVAWTTDDINGTSTNPLQAFGVNATDANPNIQCTQIYIEINYVPLDSSVVPTGISVSTNPVLLGDSTILSVIGGFLGSGASWIWYSGSCGGTYEGTGDSIIVSPATTTTYYVRAEGTCNTTSCASVTVVVNTLSISVSPINWSIGTIDAGAIQVSTTGTKINITNDGSTSETFTLQILDEDDRNEWTASTSESGAGTNVYVFSGIFCATTDVPISTSFNEGTSDDVITTISKPATPTTYAYTGGTANGVSVPVAESRSLWLRFDSPTAVSGTYYNQEHTVIVRIGCQQ